MNLPQPSDLIAKLHATGKATRDLMAKTTAASGAVIGGSSRSPAPITQPAPAPTAPAKGG